jgi:hypothetical protein
MPYARTRTLGGLLSGGRHNLLRHRGNLRAVGIGRSPGYHRGVIIAMMP